MSAQKFRTICAVGFTGLAVVFVGTDPHWNVQNALMAIVALGSIAVAVPWPRTQKPAAGDHRPKHA